MHIFPAPSDSEYPWIGSPESVRAAQEGMKYLIANRDRIEVLGGWKTEPKSLVGAHFAERTVIRLVNEETTEVEYFSVVTVGNRIDYPNCPSKNLPWKILLGPMTRDELIAALTEKGFPGDLLLLPFLTDLALGFVSS